MKFDTSGSFAGGHRLGRYYCHIVRNGSLYEDVGGLDAHDDTEAMSVGRAIAKLLLDDAPTASDAVMIIKDDTGRILVKASLGELSSTIQ